MSISDMALSGRYRLLRKLGRLFAQIDDAFARDDFISARANNREVAEMLALIQARPAPDDPSRISGVRWRSSESEEESPNSSRTAS